MRSKRNAGKSFRKKSFNENIISNKVCCFFLDFRQRTMMDLNCRIFSYGKSSRLTVDTETQNKL